MRPKAPKSKATLITEFDIFHDEVLQFIKPLVESKSVLDLGCVEHKLSDIHKNRIWVHDFLLSVGKDVTGVDYLRDAVAELRRRGYDIVCQNVENLDLGKKFDVVFAGELIEHLSNPGEFLENVRKHLRNDGKFILTTQNAFSLYRAMSIVLHRTNSPANNPEHVCYYSPDTIVNLLQRYGFEVREISYAHYPVKKLSLKQRLVRICSTVVGDRFKETMIVVSTIS